MLDVFVLQNQHMLRLFLCNKFVAPKNEFIDNLSKMLVREMNVLEWSDFSCCIGFLEIAVYTTDTIKKRILLSPHFQLHIKRMGMPETDGFYSLSVT
jgi:hypothetical protein